MVPFVFLLRFLLVQRYLVPHGIGDDDRHFITVISGDDLIYMGGIELFLGLYEFNSQWSGLVP
jgi:hypothetical protein